MPECVVKYTINLAHLPHQKYSDNILRFLGLYLRLGIYEVFQPKKEKNKDYDCLTLIIKYCHNALTTETTITIKCWATARSSTSSPLQLRDRGLCLFLCCVSQRRCWVSQPRNSRRRAIWLTQPRGRMRMQRPNSGGTNMVSTSSSGSLLPLKTWKGQGSWSKTINFNPYFTPCSYSFFSYRHFFVYIKSM